MKNGKSNGATTSLMEVPLRTAVELERIDAPSDEVEPLLERGILPGCRLHRIRNSPAGDPVISVEGTLLALRRESAAQIFVREV
ncbi:FeoA family protein [Candidatus Palauibacter sp.]|uniref:FeoA family protein n=1 Tax=Candidatus Palauibacter sp. TaxID=3101350 RepID=UPI003B01FE1B